MPDSNLAAIRTKVRRLTRSPSPTQITDDEINEYINTFVLYEMPQRSYLFTNKTTFTFFTEPYIDEYASNNPAVELDDFTNKYVSFEGPVYIAGQSVPLYLNPSDFYGSYQKQTKLDYITIGDGVTVNYTGTLSSIPIVQGAVLFSSVDVNNNSLALYDENVLGATTATLTGTGTGTINYVTGVYDITFSAAPALNVNINSQTLPYGASQPQAILYFDNKFKVRPVPDQAYRVEVQAYKIPDEITVGNSPEKKAWFSYIAVATAKEILYDRMDIGSVASLEPLLLEKEILVNRPSIVQKAKNSVKTIFNSGIPLTRSPFRY